MRLDASEATWSNGTNGDHSTIGVAQVVDAAAPGPAGELGVLARGEERAGLARELRQPLDDDRAGRHVDAERQRLGGEHRLDQALDEAGLDRLLERRDHAGVVGREAHLERRRPAVVAEHVEVVVGEGRGALVDDGPDADPLVGRRQPQAGVEAGGHGLLAAHAAEDEVERRQHLAVVEDLDDLGPARGEEPAARAPVPPPLAAATDHVVVEPLGLAGSGWPSTSVGSRCGSSLWRSPTR